MERNTKKKGPIIAIIIICIILILVLAGGAAAYYFCFRPIVKVNKALEAEDYQTASDLFDELKREEKEDVISRMENLASNLRRDYEKEEIDYDDVMDIYDVLGEEILEDNKNLAKNTEKIEALKESREAFATGKSAMDDEDYSVAIEEFGKVIEKDSNYEKAQKFIAECEELMQADVLGVWVGGYDVTNVLTSAIGISSSDAPELVFPIYCEFIDDSKGRLYVEQEDIEELMDKVIDFVLPLRIEQYADVFGVTERELNSMISMIYGQSIREYIKSEAMASFATESGNLDVRFTYESTADGIIANDGSDDDIRFIIDDDKLLLTSYNTESIDILEEYGVKLPITLERKMY